MIVTSIKEIFVLFDRLWRTLSFKDFSYELTDKRHFYITLNGVTHHRYLSEILRSPTHLRYAITPDRNLKLLLDPGVLFLPLRRGIFHFLIVKKVIRLN